MANVKKTITEGAIKKMIEETAKYKKAVSDIWKDAEVLNKKLGELNESHKGFSGSFGFNGDSSAISKTGFVNDMGPISHLSDLGAEIQAAQAAELAKQAEEASLNEDIMDKFARMQEEIDSLKK